MRPLRPAAVAGALFVLAFAFRFFSYTGFANDHFVHLARAQQMLLGAWPVRDFVDPGMPLMYGVSAIGLLLFGHNLLGEALIVFSALAGAAVLSLHAARTLSGSLPLAAAAILLQVALYPHSYGYPKLLLSAAAIVMCWGYIDRPSPRRAAGLGLLVAVAFLFRHDHGVFIGAAAALAIAAAGRLRSRDAGVFAAATGVAVAPWALLVAMSPGGVTGYITSALEFSRIEAAQTYLAWPAFDIDPARGLWAGGGPGPGLPVGVNSEALLYYTFLALPLVALAWIAWKRDKVAPTPHAAAKLLVLVLLAVCVDAAFLRDPLDGRLPDVAVPLSVLAAWVAAAAVRELRARPAVVRIAGIVLLAAFGTCVTGAVTVVGQTREQIDRIGSLLPGDLAEKTTGTIRALRVAYASERVPGATSLALAPVYDYLQRCTGPQDRLTYFGFAPEAYFFAARGFGVGHVVYIGRYYSAAGEQELTIARLERERVPLVVLPDPGDFREGFPLLASYLDASFSPAGQLELPGDRRAAILTTRRLPPTGTDTVTGWSCFR